MAAPNSLVFCHVNAESLQPHFVDIEQIIHAHNVHVLGISESWLKPHTSSQLFHIPGYVLVRHDRISNIRGGVALFIHESLNFKIVAQSNRPPVYEKRPEFLFLLLRVGSFRILLGVIYSTPKGGHWSDVEEALLECSAPYDFLILLGDFNINWRANSGNLAPKKILAKFFDEFDVMPLPFQQTYHRSNSQSTIDYICVSDASRVANFYQTRQPNISEHDAVFATFTYYPHRTSTLAR